MLGAILGDIIGSPYEFKNTKHFHSLFTNRSHITDDTVMTIAVADGLMMAGKQATVDEIKEMVVRSMRYWGNAYPYAGYGGYFRKWLQSDNPEPYHSYANGSAMRVSAVGWLYDTLERTEEVAKATALLTHDHKEGIKGAMAIAAAIFLLRNEVSKEDVKDYIEKEYHYDLEHLSYKHDTSCQVTVPQAFIAFLNSDSFEDTIRKAIAIGGDSDTIACMAGSLAHAYYGIEDKFIVEAHQRLDDEMLYVLACFDICLGKYRDDCHLLQRAGFDFYDKNTDRNFDRLKREMVYALLVEQYIFVPFVAPSSWKNPIDRCEDIPFEMKTCIQDDEAFLSFYTTDFVARYLSDEQTYMTMPLKEILHRGLMIEGVTMNPHGKPVTLTKESIQVILQEYQNIIGGPNNEKTN